MKEFFTNKNYDILKLNKQLNCLNQIAEAVEYEKITLDEILKRISTVISGALLSFKNCSVELEAERALYHSESFNFSEHSCEFPIYIDHAKKGFLRIYTDECCRNSEMLLCEEDKKFVFYLCERIGRIIQRHQLSAKLCQTQKKLEIKNKLLENKYAALQELLDHIEVERDRRNNEIRTNVETVINPILSKMKVSRSPEKYYPHLEKALENLTSRFNVTLNYQYSKLTRKEKEICNYVKDGLSSKEIGDILNLSEQTVSKHRAHIRKKLDITHRNISLNSFLESLNISDYHI